VIFLDLILSPYCFEELLMSQAVEQEAFTRLLVEKGDIQKGIVFGDDKGSQ